ncbi:MAG: MATE family efflux transporter [Muribaculaceae bacterium]|nr:MATE family efflux transporter [Muribaculaceae bacterium]
MDISGKIEGSGESMKAEEKKGLNKEILALALPAIFSNITVPILGLSDTYISGHLGSDRYVAAIAVGSMMVNSVYWLLGFLRAGTTGLTAEALGRGNMHQTRGIFTISFLIAVMLGMLIILIAYPLGELMIGLMSPPHETGGLGLSYYMISIMSAPALLSTMTITGWMIGMQNTFYPMIMAISVNVVNIAMSFLLVFGAGMGFYGVAIGTLTANWFGLGLGLILARMLAHRYSQRGLWVSVKGLSKQVDIKRFFRVNSDLMLRSACILGATFGMTTFGGRMGDEVLAVNAIIMQLFLFFSYFSDGFAFSAEALCGRLAGAGNFRYMHTTVRRLWSWCGAIGVTFGAVYLIFAPQIAWMLSESSEIAKGVTELRIVVGVIPVISVMAFLYDGIYIGITATRKMLIVTFIAVSIFLGTYFVSKMCGVTDPRILNPIVWGGFLTFLAVRAIGLILLYPSAIRQYKTTSR